NYFELKNKMQISESIKITAPVDSDHLLVPENCELIPVATLIQNLDPFTNRVDSRVLVDKNIWTQLKLYEQIAIIMDFAMMKDYDQTNLIGSRIFMGYWFSDSINSLSAKTWMDFISYLEFPYFEYQSYKLHLKGERFYHKNGTLSRLDFYKKNALTINNQTIEVTGNAWTSPDGKILELNQTSSYFHTLPVGDKIEIKGSGDQKLIFREDEKSSLQAGTIVTNGKNISYYNHSLKLTEYSFLSLITFFESGNIGQIKVDSAIVKIRGKIYKILGTPPDVGYKYSPVISFFDNGEVQCGECFIKGQIFLNEKMRPYTTTNSETLCFNKDGLLLIKKPY
ncbi:MAG: hypothetical protein K2Q18_05350, partial [Bdellovibrionales bacterium]|nr:hypothetical protein [Bdellovibrionales bacterium]